METEKFLLPLSWVYRFDSKRNSILTLCLTAAALGLGFILSYSTMSFLTAILLALLVAYQIYQFFGYWLYQVENREKISQACLIGEGLFKRDLDEHKGWPLLEKASFDDPSRYSRESMRISILDAKDRLKYRKNIYRQILIALSLFYLAIWISTEISILIPFTMIIISFFHANFLAKIVEQRRFIKGLEKFDEHHKNMDGFIYQTIIRTEPELHPAKKESSHGTARWLSEYEKNCIGYWGDGLWLGGGYFDRSEGSLLTAASSRSGKGAAVILPNLLIKRKYPYSFVVLDPKGTNACISAAFQSSVGQRVVILDPTGIQDKLGAKHGIETSCLNPLDFIDRSNLVSECISLAKMLIPHDPKGEKYWTEEGVDLFSSILMHIMTFESYEGKRSLVTVYELMRYATWQEIFDEMSTNTACDQEILVAAKKFREVMVSTEKTFTSMISVAQQALNWLKDPLLKKSLSKSDFDATEIGKGGLSIYITVPTDHADNYFNWSRIVVYTLMKINRAPMPFKRAACYYLLDEFPQLGRFTDIQNYLATSSEYNIRIWLFIQNIPQLDLVYDQNSRDSFIGNCRVFQAFGVNDLVTAKLVSERLGAETIKYMTNNRSGSYTQSKQGYGVNQSYGSSITEGSGISENFSSRSLLNPDEVLLEQRIMVFTDYGRMRLEKWQYWMTDVNYGDANSRKLSTKYHEIISSNAQENPNFVEKPDFSGPNEQLN